jgi:phospholipid transport system transporter-binding protein
MKTTKRKSKTATKASAPAVEVEARTHANSAPGVVPVVVLASHCTVKDAAAMKLDLCALVHAEEVIVDVSAVERIDTSAMQLLCAFARNCAKRNQKVTWKGESSSWREAVRLLGTGQLLGTAHAEGKPA